MSDEKIEVILDAIFYTTLVGFLIYGLYAAGNNQSFDNECSKACFPARSVTPVIDMKNQCLCDEGHGKWRYQDVKRTD